MSFFQITGNPQLRNAKWSTKAGDSTKGDYAIFPLCESDERRNLKFIGTAFFICTNGIFVTAKHVVMDSSGRQPIQPLTAIQFIENNQHVLRPVQSLSTNDTDVAIGVLAPATHQGTGEPLLNSILTLTMKIPPALTTEIPYRANIVTTFAYPKSFVRDEESVRHMHFETSWHSGFVIEYLPHGRDNVMLPGPCYRTTMDIFHGASGGPAMNSEAKVFGINSTGYEGVQESYVSAIQSIGGLRIDEAMLPGDSGARSVTTNELVERGFILVD
jgi:hypothetical protein